MRTFPSRTSKRLAIATLVTALGLAAGTAAAAQQCYDFNAAAAGISFNVGAMLALNDADLVFEEFQQADGTWVFGGEAEVVVSNEANGTPMQELEMGNINAHFTLDHDVDRVRFHYGDLAVDSAGANVNFAVNGDFRNVASFAALNGLVVGGANVTVNFNNGVGFQRGIVEIYAQTGKVIDDVLVGGQEFYLDDFCLHW